MKETVLYKQRETLGRSNFRSRQPHWPSRQSNLGRLTKIAKTKGLSLFVFLLIPILLFLLSCGGDEFNDGEDYGDILSTPEGLVLTEEEHEIGWGRSDCTVCHNLENIHLADSSEIGIDIESIHDQVLEEGVSGCSACHGDNGVEE